MRLFSTLMLIVALISQGAVARVHLMPDLSATEMAAMHGDHGHHGDASMAASHCGQPMPPSHDCCDHGAQTQPMECHDASQPCNGDCGMCKVFSPAGVALLGSVFPSLTPSPERALPQAKSFHSVALSQDSKPPIA
ncbi:hypothetical protein [Ferrimonas balearica]|uniref:hypothetical protein n=1 Tax=Ferrimonas balearica TaxID=44012 RepID=UPI001C996E21|nr:hypothetical protein [Ferrimonas balearica]MBY5994065.1 hypothetical protein [Ferrimonas balearica]